MRELKNTGRSRVVQTFDGRVTKCFNGPKADQRYRNEFKVLSYLNEQRCPFVPRLLSSSPKRLSLTTSYCGLPALWLAEQKVVEVFDQLLDYGVRHEDPAARNILYDDQRDEFVVIDFELATIIEKGSSGFFPAELTLTHVESLLALSTSQSLQAAHSTPS